MSHNVHKLRVKPLASYRVASGETPVFIKHYLESLDCPRALTIWLLFSNTEHDQLVDVECDPIDYENVFDFRAAYAATAFLSKYKRLSLSTDPDAVAREKFEKFESHCRSVNGRFRNLAQDRLFTGPAVQLHNAVVRKIARILGPIPYQDIFDDANWGPGATTLMKRSVSSSANKFQFETGITRDLYHLLCSSGHFGHQYPLWKEHLDTVGFPTFCVGNKVVTVPKNAKTDRVIAIEPGINLWFQKAVGEVLNRRLRKYGIDLRNQSRNQYLAKVGSKDSSLATIDFSSASDSISLEAVRSLLPPDWFHLLDLLRSHYGVQGDSTYRKWNKFSSMGNGFTFQLESLIFFAVASCCEEFERPEFNQPGIVSVYGDDVIIPTYCLESFVLLSTFYGFIVNKSKSFSTTYFRESCGAHWANGIDVKPFYLKDNVKTLASVFRAANGVRRLAHRWMNFSGCDSAFEHCFYHLVNLVPKAFRLRIPETLGDGGFISNFDEACPPRAKHGIEGYFVTNVVEMARKRPFDGVGLLLSFLWGCDTGILSETIDRRPPTSNSFIGVRVIQSQEMNNNSLLHGSTETSIKRSLVPSWYDLGPWL